ncbi:MAG: hypothetical protein KJ728_01680 [Alphaproteobacteria bacterium]|uniref:hypothetical protein n=1 Tax=Brevundimonas sp. TaxID=1871086 RepID=UPI001D2F4B13|nr:hypothetical protein [Alphaproteobacteria bacterium]MBU1520117.1 hypothetical protein [Alphaproteobacteria bacterium]MBU2029183.1 hypothetical protein [Alphaproteobacteria bacterium]MBU2165862.1 hypothetical protein [Alphaproteobacteria bacterium]MBU2232744.1 hypothetical protein [Alphaproteobacteria bacterium]
MPKAFMTRGLSIAALAAAVFLASCTTKEPEAPPPPPPPPPPVSLNEGVAQAASIYVAFLREAETIQPGGFPDAESIQAAIRKGASYEPAQLSRGLIAYGSIIALQSPEFVAGVRQFAADPVQRQQMIAQIVADPAYAATLPGADAAAGLITATIGKDAVAMRAIAEAVEADAYTVQERNDPRRRWAVTHVPNREVRLEGAKTLSAATMLPSGDESSRLFTAANTGQGLSVEASRKAPPYTPALTRSLAIAALAALGAAGDEARANTDALVVETNSEFCLNMSKLMLFQCLAASRPAYEDMFCLGRHVARDLATCTTQAVLTTSITVGDPEETSTPAAAVSPVSVTLTQTPAPSPTASLNTSPSSSR